MNNEKLTGIFHDAITGETVERELTDEEIAALPRDENDDSEPA